MFGSDSSGRRQELQDSVVVGQDGYLFQRDQATFEQVCGQIVLTDNEIEQWRALLEARQAWCQVRGIRHVTLIVPEKHVIYSDKLPAGHHVSGRRPVCALLSALDGDMRDHIVYPEARLRAGRAGGAVFPRGDSHWTQYGAYLGYRALCDAMPIAPASAILSDSQMLRHTARRAGDLAIRLDADADEDIEFLAHKRSHAVSKLFDSALAGPGRVNIFEQHATDLPTCVMFRDSGASALLPFLAVHFSRLVAITSYRFFHDLVRDERPAIVVSQLHEGTLARPGLPGEGAAGHFPRDYAADRFAAHTCAGLPLPRHMDLVLSFDARGNGLPSLRDGWHPPGRSMTFAAGRHSRLSIPNTLAPADYGLRLEFICHTGPRGDAGRACHVRLNGEPCGVFEADQAFLTCTLPIRRDLTDSATTFEIGVEHPDSAAGPDSRTAAPDAGFALALVRIVLHRIGR